MKVTFKLEGADELRANLRKLTQATRRNQLRRVLKDAMDPLARAVKARAPKRYGDLEENLVVGTKLTKRQRQMSSKSEVQLHFGTADPAGLMEEFQLGNNKDSTPFFRPEWEGRKRSILDYIGRELGNLVMKAAARADRKAARKRRR